MKALPAVALLFVTACTTSTREARVAPAIAVEGAEAASSTRNPPVGAVTLPADRTLAANLAAAPMLATFTRAVSSAGLGESLAAPGPLTLFVPTQEAFGRLAPGTIEALLKPENRASLTKLVQLHLVPGRLSSVELVRSVRAGGGRATLTTVAGEELNLSLTGSVVTLADGGGNKSYVEVADVRQANGTMHVVNGVLVPRIR